MRVVKEVDLEMFTRSSAGVGTCECYPMNKDMKSKYDKHWWGGWWENYLWSHHWVLSLVLNHWLAASRNINIKRGANEHIDEPNYQQ